MRTPEKISKILELVEEPYAVKNLLSEDDIDHLITIFDEQGSRTGPYSNLIQKNTGPITLDLYEYYKDPIVEKILKNIETHIGKFEVTAAFFFRTDYPHIIHNDDTFELPDSVYKAITIPLLLDGFTKSYPKLCFFDQFYFHGPAKFFKGSSDIPTYYNKQVYEYDNIHGLVETKVKDHEKYFTHLNPRWLEGLSLHSTLDWIPGDALIFDSVRLHCASDFRNLGIKSKLGISIFTKKC